MELFKALKEKDYASINEYCKDKIADLVAGRIFGAKTKYLNGLRGIEEDTEIVIKSDDEDDHKKAKETDKDGGGDEDDREEAKDSDDGDEKDLKKESKDEEDVEEKPSKKKSTKKVTTKDADKFADASS